VVDEQEERRLDLLDQAQVRRAHERAPVVAEALLVAAGPPVPLLPEPLRADHRLLEVDGGEVVADALAGHEHAQREVGVLGDGVRVPPAEPAQRGHADRAVRAAVRGQLEQRLPAVLVDQVAGEEVDEDGRGHLRVAAVADDAAAHHRADDRVAEVPDQPPQRRRVRLVVGVEDDGDLGVDQVQGVVERAGLAAAGARRAVQHAQPRLPGGPGVEPVAGGVVGAVVDHDEGEPVGRVVQREQRGDHPVDDELLVLAADEDRDRRRPARQPDVGGEHVVLGPAGGGDGERQVPAEVDAEDDVEHAAENAEGLVEAVEEGGQGEAADVGEQHQGPALGPAGVRVRRGDGGVRRGRGAERGRTADHRPHLPARGTCGGARTPPFSSSARGLRA
jgi:hypothetical protein